MLLQKAKKKKKQKNEEDKLTDNHLKVVNTGKFFFCTYCQTKRMKKVFSSTGISSDQNIGNEKEKNQLTFDYCLLKHNRN